MTSNKPGVPEKLARALHNIVWQVKAAHIIVDEDMRSFGRPHREEDWGDSDHVDKGDVVILGSTMPNQVLGAVGVLRDKRIVEHELEDGGTFEEYQWLVENVHGDKTWWTNVDPVRVPIGNRAADAERDAEGGSDDAE